MTVAVLASAACSTTRAVVAHKSFVPLKLLSLFAIPNALLVSAYFGSAAAAVRLLTGLIDSHYHQHLLLLFFIYKSRCLDAIALLLWVLIFCSTKSTTTRTPTTALLIVSPLRCRTAHANVS